MAIRTWTSHTYTYEAQSEEDSDDRRTMRTLKRHDRDDRVSVSIHPHSVSPIHCLIVLTLFWEDISESNSNEEEIQRPRRSTESRWSYPFHQARCSYSSNANFELNYLYFKNPLSPLFWFPLVMQLWIKATKEGSVWNGVQTANLYV